MDLVLVSVGFVVFSVLLCVFVCISFSCLGFSSFLPCFSGFSSCRFRLLRVGFCVFFVLCRHFIVRYLPCFSLSLSNSFDGF